MWEARVDGTRLLLVFTDETDDSIERVRTFSDGRKAEQELESLVREQLADGFVEVTPPAWRAFLDELVSFWKQDCPHFDARALRDRVLALPDAEAVVTQVMELGHKYVAERDGLRLDLDHAIEGKQWAAAWLMRRGPDVLPALLLALRHHDEGGQTGVEVVLGELGSRDDDVLEALLAVMEHPPPNDWRSGRSAGHMPAWLVAKLGPFDDRVLGRLVAMLDAGDFRTSDAAAWVLAEQAGDDRCFQALVAVLPRARKSDGLAHVILRAAEVRPDPVFRAHLEWMRSSRRFRGADLRERIDRALALQPP